MQEPDSASTTSQEELNTSEGNNYLEKADTDSATVEHRSEGLEAGIQWPEEEETAAWERPARSSPWKGACTGVLQSQYWLFNAALYDRQSINQIASYLGLI